MPLKTLKRWTWTGLLVLGACGGGGGGNNNDGPATLFVSDVGTDLVSIWRPVDGVDGDVAPDSVIGGLANSGIDQPYGIFYDPRGDTLIVGDTNSDSVKFFDAVSALDGDVAPTRTLKGPATLLVGGNGYEVFVDTTRDLLYLAVSGGVFVYANASTIDGDVAPVRTITGVATGFSGNRDMRLFVDAAHDRLYVLDSDNAALMVYDAASTVDGNAAPDRVLTGGNTLFNFPWGIDVDVGRDILYVADESNDEVYVFDNASTVDGDLAPDRVLSGAATTLSGPADIEVDPATDRLYVTNSNPAAVLIWDGASTVDGEVAPNRSITGVATDLDAPKDLALPR